MVVRSQDITFNDTYVRDVKQWNWECHTVKNITYNNRNDKFCNQLRRAALRHIKFHKSLLPKKQDPGRPHILYYIYYMMPGQKPWL